MDDDIKKLRSLVVCSWAVMILIWLFCFISGRNCGESNYDYGILYNLDTEVPLTYEVGDESAIY